MILRLENLVEPDDVRVADLLQNVDLLHHFLLGKLVLHMLLVDGFDSHVAPSKLVDAKSYLAKGTFADELHELVEFERGWWQTFLLLTVSLVEFDQLITLLHDLFINFVLLPKQIRHLVIHNFLGSPLRRRPPTQPQHVVSLKQPFIRRIPSPTLALDIPLQLIRVLLTGP